MVHQIRRSRASDFPASRTATRNATHVTASGGQADLRAPGGGAPPRFEIWDGSRFVRMDPIVVETVRTRPLDDMRDLRDALPTVGRPRHAHTWAAPPPEPRKAREPERRNTWAQPSKVADRLRENFPEQLDAMPPEYFSTFVETEFPHTQAPLPRRPPERHPDAFPRRGEFEARRREHEPRRERPEPRREAPRVDERYVQTIDGRVVGAMRALEHAVNAYIPIDVVQRVSDACDASPRLGEHVFGPNARVVALGRAFGVHTGDVIDELVRSKPRDLERLMAALPTRIDPGVFDRLAECIRQTPAATRTAVWKEALPDVLRHIDGAADRSKRPSGLVVQVLKLLATHASDSLGYAGAHEALRRLGQRPPLPQALAPEIAALTRPIEKAAMERLTKKLATDVAFYRRCTENAQPTTRDEVEAIIIGPKRREQPIKPPPVNVHVKSLKRGRAPSSILGNPKRRRV